MEMDAVAGVTARQGKHGRGNGAGRAQTTGELQRSWQEPRASENGASRVREIDLASSVSLHQKLPKRYLGR